MNGSLRARGALIPRIDVLTGFREPFRFEREEEMTGLLMEALAHNASDLYIQPELPICAMVEGRMVAMTDRTIDYAEIQELLKWLAGRDTAVTDIVAGKSVNAKYDLFDPAKRDARGDKVRYPFRVNASPIEHYSDTGAQLVLRAIGQDPPRWGDVGLTEDLLRLLTPRDGIIYVAGATGSGKTTTLAAVIRHCLEDDTPIKGNFITAEEPIEFSFRNVHSSHSIIVQSQVPMHFPSFYASNREAMRRKPGLMMVGELRDQESIQTAVEAAQTGHPVMGTVHATNASATLRRLISRFPQEERSTAIYDIIDSARLIMAQRLVTGVDGRRLAVREYVAFTDSVKERLADLPSMGKVTQALRAIVESEGHSFSKEADRLLAAGRITETVAESLRHE